MRILKCRGLGFLRFGERIKFDSGIERKEYPLTPPQGEHAAIESVFAEKVTVKTFASWAQPRVNGAHEESSGS